MFQIKHFGDYHDIDDCMEGWKREELGCFPPKEGDCYCCQYFAVFWKGKRPTREAVLKRLKEKVLTESFQACSYPEIEVEFDESEVDYK